MRRGLGIVALAAGVLAVVAGAAVLLLPYDNRVGVPGFADTVSVRCQAPLVDAVRSDDAAEGWFRLSTEEGTVDFGEVDESGAASGDITTGGSLCYPDSVQRAALGAGLVTFGAIVLIGRQLLRARRREDDDLEVPPPGEQAEPPAETKADGDGDGDGPSAAEPGPGVSSEA